MALIKPLSQLDADDLAMFELWEIAPGDRDEDDEPRVRPVDSDVVPVDDDDTVYHVACAVELASGRTLTGHIAVRNGALEAMSPTVVTDAGDAFDLGHPPLGHRLLAFETLAGAPYASVFPVRWHLRLALDGESAYREGELSLAPQDEPRLH
jgi:hypothetical protein